MYLRKIIANEEKHQSDLLKSYQVIKENHAIHESINYAQRIQHALIPSEKAFKRAFNDGFLLFKGRDKVSGDFPFLYKVDNANIIYAAAIDCTGHGVPGALLSIIGHFLINDIIKSKRETSPEKILEILHWDLVAVLEQHQNAHQNDGMDMALIKVDYETNKVEFSGAHRPLFHFHNGELNEYRGSPLPVGGTQYQKKRKIEFKKHTFAFEQHDRLYFFSDGITDQFDMENHRKFSKKRLKNLLTDLQESPLSEIGEKVNQAFIHWKGATKQIDDVLLCGVEL